MEPTPPPDTAGAGGEAPDPFQNAVDAGGRGGDAYGRYLDTLRQVQTLSSSTDPPEPTLDEAAEALDIVVRLLEPWVVSERQRLAGARPDLPARGNPLLPPFVVDAQTPDLIRGRVVFTRYYLGGNSAVHGGAIPLLFDHILGYLANVGRARSRTAYLHVNYRAIVPVDVEVQLEASVDREEGRKRWLTGRITDGDRLLSDTEGLFVALRPGQP